MAGGLLNLIAYGNQNIILNGNPRKTFFKSAYAKYTNFGLQKFRIDFDGQRNLRLTESSIFEFTVPRYGDLLMDTYMVVNLPTIWSPVMPPQTDSSGVLGAWQPYDFKWIDNIGTQMIERVRFTVGGATIQEFTGQYLHCLVERDFNGTKKQLYYEMTGNVPELNNPAYGFGRKGVYPSTFYGGTSESAEPINRDYKDAYDQLGSEPSIRGRQLYVPLNIWFTMASKMAFPIAGLQYAELKIEVTLRPVQDLFTVSKIYMNGDDTNDAYLKQYIKPNFNDYRYQFYRFLQSPPKVDISSLDAYQDKRTLWNADVHLLSTFAFLTDDEVRMFALEPQKYLVKQAYTTLFDNIVGSKKVDLKSLGLVSNWMWFMQRSDVSTRNQWSNYTNWDYSVPPFPPFQADERTCGGIVINGSPNYPPTDVSKELQLYNTGTYEALNTRDIMEMWAVVLDGKYRENQFQRGVVDYVEKYTRTMGGAPSGIYCYNFALQADVTECQPSGAINMSKFSTVEIEVTTIQPTLNADYQFTEIRSPITNEVVATQIPRAGIYNYQYDMVVMEERYNILNIQNGTAGLEFSR
jgi:hypothetical protein